MKQKLMSRCIDINSSYCPCLLAETNHCVQCSQLQGNELCDCNWTGVCILCEKLWQAKKPKFAGADAPIRMECESEPVILDRPGEHVFLVRLSVDGKLAGELNRLGAFVFLRRAIDPPFCHFPVGVMSVTGNAIDVLIETRGPKSARLLEEPYETILIRGPYYNGIYGQPWIEHMNCGKILLVAGGMGQAPIWPAAVRLAEAGNEITAILAPGTMAHNLIEEDLRKLGVSVFSVKSMRQSGFPLLQEQLSNPLAMPDLVVSAGPDEMHYAVIRAMDEAGVNVPMAATNNATMCCGEGLCGSCLKETKDGRTIRACKVQMPFAELNQDY